MSLIEKFDQFEDASKLFLKGFNYAEIARELTISPAEAKKLVVEYKQFIQHRVNEDPDFLDRVAEHTMLLLDEVNLLSKEAWKIHAQAVEFEMVDKQIASIKLASDLTEKRAKLLQTMGARMDGGNTAKMQRLEKVNEIVSNIIKEIVADCPKCRVEAQVRLAEAFAMMDKPEQMGEPVPLDYIEGEIVDEDQGSDQI